MRLIDLTGRQFGRLTVLRKDPIRRGNGQRLYVAWICRCQCGTEKSILGNSLRYGHAQSCGCRQREIAVESGRKSATHGMTRRTGDASIHPVWKVWHGMKTRCLNPNVKEWKNYGGRGITICQEWIDSFEAFFEHVGDRPSPKHSIDRIDNERGYEPGNVRWATMSEQAFNKRKSPVCIKCGTPFDDENTYINPTTGWRTCKNCRRERQRNTDPDVQRQRQRKWRQKNPDYQREYKRKRREEGRN